MVGDSGDKVELSEVVGEVVGLEVVGDIKSVMAGSAVVDDIQSA